MKRQSAVEKELHHQIEVINGEMNRLTNVIDNATARRSALFDFRNDIEYRINMLRQQETRRKVDSNASQ